MYVNFLSTYSDKKSCMHTSTTLQTSTTRFVSDSWASCCSFLTSVNLLKCMKVMYRRRRREIQTQALCMAPTFGRRLLFPDDRCCAVSYARLLLNDSMLKPQQHRHGIDLSRERECGHGIDDVQHFFLECERYRHIRTEMINDITTIWQGSDNLISSHLICSDKTSNSSDNDSWAGHARLRYERLRQPITN